MTFDKMAATLALALTLTACSTNAPAPDADTLDRTAEVEKRGDEAPTDGEEPQPPEGFTISGTVRALDGAALEVPAKIMVIWAVDTPEGDKIYKLGEGSLGEGTFSLTLPVTRPPRAALTTLDDFSFGVGMLVVVDASVEVPEGMMSEELLGQIFEDGILGNAPRHALVYREGSTEGKERLEKLQWPNAFTEGEITCGAGVEKEGMFAIFEPSACDSFEILIGSKEWINWT